jgi:hypothetical protein
MDRMTSQTLRALLRTCGVLLLVLVSACASHGPEPQTLGFLDNYEELSPGRKGQASLIYIDGEADFSIYSAILIEPVVAWPGSPDQPAVVTRERATNLDEALRRELTLEFDLVQQPGLGALQLRAALASTKGSYLILEVELLDGVSGQRLVAAVDRQKLESTDSSSQTDAWAVLIRNRLASFRQFDAAWRTREAGGAR